MNKSHNPRILFIAPLPPPIHGSTVVSQQIKTSKMVNESFRCDWVNMSTSRRMDEIGKTTFSKPFRMAGALLKTLWLLITRRYCLCYLAITCHGAGFLKDAPFVLLCKLFGRKIVIHQHNKGMAKDVNRWPYRWLLPMVYKNAKVILLSWHLYPDIEKIVSKENVLVCPNGIKVDDGTGLAIHGSQEEEKIPRLLFLSNLMESKGVIVLLDALKVLADKGISFRCDFVGGETKEINTKRFAEEVDKRGLNRITFYHGRKYGEEKETILEQSDVFVFPTNEDCFPLVLLEAMSHGLPCVTTDEGGIPDIVVDGENGVVVQRQDPKSLAVGIEKLIVDTDLRRIMGEAGRKRLKIRFTEEMFEDNMLSVLERVVLEESKTKRR